MIALLQRVTRAEVVVGGTCVARIGAGLLSFIGVERGDSVCEAERLLERLLTYRVFADSAGRMNRSLTQADGGLPLVPHLPWRPTRARARTQASHRLPHRNRDGSCLPTAAR